MSFLPFWHWFDKMFVVGTGKSDTVRSREISFQVHDLRVCLYVGEIIVYLSSQD